MTALGLTHGRRSNKNIVLASAGRQPRPTKKEMR